MRFAPPPVVRHGLTVARRSDLPDCCSRGLWPTDTKQSCGPRLASLLSSKWHSACGLTATMSGAFCTAWGSVARNPSAEHSSGMKNGSRDGEPRTGHG